MTDDIAIVTEAKMKSDSLAKIFWQLEILSLTRNEC